jgi:hypothetical protein
MYSIADASESEDAFMAVQIDALHQRIHAANTPLAARHDAHYVQLSVSPPYVYPVWYNPHIRHLVFVELFNAFFAPHGGGAQQLCIAQSEVGEESGQHTQVSSVLAAVEEAAIGELLHQLGAAEHLLASRPNGPWVHLLLYGGSSCSDDSAAQAGKRGVTSAHVGLVSCRAVPPPPVDCQLKRTSQSELPPTLVWELRFAQLPGAMSTAEAVLQMAHGGIEPIRVGGHDAVAASGREGVVDRWCTNMAVMLQNAYVAERRHPIVHA